jgi:uncharacterized alpha-E superfamily protein
VLGRSLERVDMTARLLSTHTVAGGTIPSWLTLLRSCGAWEPYLRTHRGAVDDRRAAAFLLLNRLFPRSVFRSLSTAESCLAELTPVGRSAMPSEPARVLGRARTELEYRRADELLAELPVLLPSLQRACSAANDAVSARYFRHTRAVSWAQESA